ncbi:hypothetical protein H6G91_17160 [Nostoc muscorum FACHB-395]|nr:hypothetical protein [Desmonostoc muscorum FACHB-395]
MKFPISPVIWAALAGNVLCLGVVTAATVSERLKSDTAIADRAKSLSVLAKHVLSDTCWKSSQPEPFKLGDSITLDGSEDGRSPTSCIYNPQTKQFIFLAYSGGQLVVNQVYSRREVRNQISILKQQHKQENN